VQPTIGDAFRRVAPLLPLVHDGLTIELVHRDADVVACRFAFAPGLAAPGALLEHLLARCVVLGRLIAGPRYAPPLRVTFRHRRPSDTRPHRALFAAPVLFSETEDALVFAESFLATPLARPNPGLDRILVDDAARRYEALPKSSSFTDHARRFIASRLDGGDASLEAFAAHVRKHPRSVRRRLAAEGLTYRGLVDAMRRALGERWLREGLPMVEIAQRLGFSEAAAFRRAFRRWKGHGPGKARRTRGG
jgi:AraC-like DNA-binding protein